MQETKGNSKARQDALWAYLTLTAGTLLAWMPLLRRSLPVADDFYVINLINSSAQILPDGPWRPLGILSFWSFRASPIYPTALALITHLASVILLFLVCRLLFLGIRLPLAAALIFAMFPFGYEAMTWMSAYNFVIPVVFFLANLLLLYSPQAWSNRPIAAPFVLSSLLALLTCFSNECLFFATAFSGAFALIQTPPGSLRSFQAFKNVGRQGWLAAAPSTGCLLWVVLYHAFKGPNPTKNITIIHPISILAVYVRQYSLLDIFGPWFSPITRSFLFFGWSWITGVAVALAIVVFLAGLYRLSNSDDPTPKTTSANFRVLMAIIGLLLGASLIYVLGGGFSWDSRKKYPLVPLMLLLACWIYRAVRKDARAPAGTFLSGSVALFAVAAMTTWLVVGAWKYESKRYNDLGQFIAANKIQGNIDVVRDPDLYRAWPHFERSLGWHFDDKLWLNYAVESWGGQDIEIGPSDKATVIQYDPRAKRWMLPSR
jgi:hypothetical protein